MVYCLVLYIFPLSVLKLYLGVPGLAAQMLLMLHKPLEKENVLWQNVNADLDFDIPLSFITLVSIFFVDLRTFLCSEEAHTPATCSMMKEWAKKCADDSEVKL